MWPGRARSGRLRYRSVVTTDSQSEADRAARVPGTLSVVAGPRGPKWLKLLCPCGCGDVVSINLMPGRQAWTIRMEREKVSISPSVVRLAGCRSHFFLVRSEAWLLRSDTDG